MIPVEINHYPVVAYAPTGSIGDTVGVVIVDRGEDGGITPRQRFVTWRVWLVGGFRWVAEHGHYDLTWFAALEDFKERI